MSTSSSLGPVVVLIPVKAFSEAKRRLSSALSSEAREMLAQRFANTVVDAAHGLPVAIVCDDPAVIRWAQSRQLTVLSEPGTGLNAAVTSAVAQLREAGAERVVVIHSDLPLARDIQWLANEPGITIVPDHRHDGTNAMSLPLIDSVLEAFEFSYGVGSFSRHLEQAQSIAGVSGLEIRVVVDADLDHDVDLPEDLDDVLGGTHLESESPRKPRPNQPAPRPKERP